MPLKPKLLDLRDYQGAAMIWFALSSTGVESVATREGGAVIFPILGKLSTLKLEIATILPYYCN